MYASRQFEVRIADRWGEREVGRKPVRALLALASDQIPRASAPAVLIAVALMATCLPALRATRVGPVIALRYE